jgi:hypothetical protein
LIKQQRHNEIDLLVKNARKERSIVKQDIREIIAKGDAEVVRAKAELEDKLSSMRANTKLAVAKINAGRDKEVNDIVTKAKIEVQKINAKADQYVSQVRSETNLIVSANRAKLIEFKGEGEKIGVQVLAAQRAYEADLARIGIIDALSKNKVLISGEAKDNIMTQLLIAQRTADAIGVDLKRK